MEEALVKQLNNHLLNYYAEKEIEDSKPKSSYVSS